MLTFLPYILSIYSKYLHELCESIFNSKIKNCDLYSTEIIMLINDRSRTCLKDWITLFANINLGYLGERYCISVPPCPDSRWGNSVPPTKYLGERRSPAFPFHYTTAHTHKLVRFDTPEYTEEKLFNAKVVAKSVGSRCLPLMLSTSSYVHTD